MTGKLKVRVLLCVGLICISCSAPEAPAVPSPAATPTSEAARATDATASSPQAKQQTAPVRRGTLVESVSSSGRVGGLDEVPLSMSIASRVLYVPVEQGDAVTEGQVLVATDTSAIEREIDLSRERLNEATARYERLQAAIQANQQRAREAQQQRTREAQQRALATQRAGAEDTQSKLRRALDELSLLRAGTPANEVLAAEGAVIAAQAGLQRAQIDLARAQGGPDPVELKAAQQEVLVATVALRKAEADLDKLQAGGDPLIISRFESELLAARSGLELARAQYALVLRGPDPLEVQAVERQIQTIRIDMETARRADVGSDRNARLIKNANVTKLELALQAAEEQLARLKAGPDASTVLAARRNFELSERNVRDATERLEIARQGADQRTIDAAKVAVEAARAGVDKAQRRVDLLEAGPTPEQIDALNSVVAGAQTAVLAAEARLAEVRNPRGRAMQIRDVEDRIAALRAQAEASAPVEAAAEPEPEPEPEPEIPELAAAQKAIAQEQIALQALEKSSASSRLVAPFPGVVAAVLVRTSDPVRPGRPSIILARGEETVVRIDLPERDASRIMPGQYATVQIENMPATFDATVTNIVEQGGARVGLLKVRWPSEEPVLGTRVQAAIQVRRKDDVLLVPQAAIRVLGSRRYVEVAEGGSTRRVDVELGMAADGNVEVVNGLREGQQVVLGS